MALLNFDDSSHKFFVDTIEAPHDMIEFGNTRFWTSIIRIPDVAALEQSLAAGTPLFNNGLVPPGLLFHAECVIKNITEAELRTRFEFGFIQGIRQNDIHLEYWGQRAEMGRAILHISMPQTFQLDTDPAIQPWTKFASQRFAITRLNNLPNVLKVTSSFKDHPLLSFNHTLIETSGQIHFIRFLSQKTDFRTIFSFRDKTTGTFEGISSSDWALEFKHTVTYSNNGGTRKVTRIGGTHLIPKGGSPSNVNATDRQIMDMAKAGTPILSPDGLSALLQDRGRRQTTIETTNPDFEPSFWQR
jgi:hypothetical protein